MRRGDTLVVLDLTRLGRDTRELLAIVEDDLHANGRHFRTLDGIVLDTSDDMCGELVFTVFAAIAADRRSEWPQQSRT
jgi:DNA invertase Pin-like site-specific DNA recombinase